MSIPLRAVVLSKRLSAVLAQPVDFFPNLWQSHNLTKATVPASDRIQCRLELAFVKGSYVICSPQPTASALAAVIILSRLLISGRKQIRKISSRQSYTTPEFPRI